MKVYRVNCLCGIVDGNKFNLLSVSNSYIVKKQICLSPKMCEIEPFRQNFQPTGYLSIVLLAIFKRIFLSPKKAAILNFPIFAKKRKTYLLNPAKYSDFIIFDPQSILNYCLQFSKKFTRFRNGGHFEFSYFCQKRQITIFFFFFLFIYFDKHINYIIEHTHTVTTTHKTMYT